MSGPPAFALPTRRYPKDAQGGHKGVEYEEKAGVGYQPQEVPALVPAVEDSRQEGHQPHTDKRGGGKHEQEGQEPVSYTHLTLPTKA